MNLEKEFNTEDEAKVWIIHNQLARRNLPPYERARLLLLLKPLIMEKAKERMLKGKKDPVQNSAQGGPAAILHIGGKEYIEDKKGKTREELAKLAGVSHDTISKVETIEKKASPEVKEAVLFSKERR